jgi:hypothetical protein
MSIESSTIVVRESLARLVALVEESPAGGEADWVERLNDSLEKLAQGLGDEASALVESEYLKKLSRAHPRLISMCAEFREDGRKLLLQAALVVRLSARGYESGTSSLPQLREATSSLIEAVRQYQHLESELSGEAGQDIGGEG